MMDSDGWDMSDSCGMDHSVLVSALAEDTLQFLVNSEVLLAGEGLVILLLLLLRVMASIDLLVEP